VNGPRTFFSSGVVSEESAVAFRESCHEFLGHHPSPRGIAGRPVSACGRVRQADLAVLIRAEQFSPQAAFGPSDDARCGLWAIFHKED
jgi:hypothetical protein